jgi:hypothetical protein
MMRFMLIVKASKESEEGQLPGPEILSEMNKFNEQLEKSGVLIDLNGLHPTSEAVRIDFDGSKRTITDGPFSETKELIAGYWLIKANSRQEAVDWALRTPFQGGQVEIRQVFELDEFPDVPEEVRATEARIAASLK